MKNAVAIPATDNREAAAFAISKARSRLIILQPFWAVLALKLDPRPNNRVETIASNGLALWYNPDWVVKTDHDELVGVLAQKALRVSLGHPWRRGARDSKLWNQAGDAVCNPIIKQSFKLPAGAIDMPEFADSSAEEAYSVLFKRQPPDGGGGSGTKQGKSGQQPGKGKGQGGGPGNQLQAPGQGQGPPQQGQGQGQGGQPSDGQGDQDGPPQGFGGDVGGCGEILDAKHDDGTALNQAERDEAEQDWKVAAIQAASVAKSAGQMPAGLERLFQEQEKPTLDWKTMLRHYMQGRRHDDYSWRRVNRRFIGRGLYLPSRENPGPGEIVVAIDTSGSISDKELAAFSAELNGILEEAKPKLLRVLYCDAKVQRADEFTPDQYPVKLTPKGGGGTAFAPVWKWLDANDSAPEAMVYLTDLWCDDFGKDPGYPVLWVTTAKEHAPFGEVVRLDLDKAA